MKTDTNKAQGNRPIKKIIAFSIVLMVSIAAWILYNNFNRLLSDALMRNFESNIASDLYELKFENLRVNIFEGTIRVFNVTILPRKKPLNDYPYINGSFRLKTEKLTLKNVEIIELLKSNKLNMERISITKPDIELVLSTDPYILLPFKDSTETVNKPTVNKKKSIESYHLNEFHLIDASFHVINSGKQREFKIEKFNISLYDLFIKERTGKDVITFKQVELSIGEFGGDLKKGPIKRVSLKDFNLKVDSLELQKTRDTVIFNFQDIRTGLKALDIQTADSLFHVTLESFHVSYRDKSISLRELSFEPNVSDAELQKKFHYQHAQFSGSVSSVNLVNINFDTLLYQRKLMIDEIVLDEVKASIFKDKTKPIDKNRKPAYLGQNIKRISLPLLIKHVKATNVNLVSVERKPDSSYAKVNLQRATVSIKNFTNLSSNEKLALTADAYIENKAHFKMNVHFDYIKPQFTFDGAFQKFNLPDLNPLIQAFTPAKINTGTLDQLAFSGTAEETKAHGSLTFLYHDLIIDLELHKQAKWKSSIIAFAANTYLNTNNPVSANSPPRIVQFHVERDMNKGFINIILKSLLNGLKETMIMSKENRKSYHDAKKKMKQQNK